MLPLFSIATQRVLLTWTGPEALPDSTAPAGLLRVHASGRTTVTQIEKEGEYVGGDVPLRLAEQTPYRLFVRSLTGEPIAVHHNDPLATGKLVVDERSTILSGTVNFEGQVGQSRFTVRVGGEEEFTFEVDVFPTKITFAEAEVMRSDLDGVLAGLAFEYLRSTNAPVSETGRVPGRASWLTMLRRVLPDLEAALDYIARYPRRDIRRDPVLVRSDRVRRSDTGLRRAILKGRGAGPSVQLDTGLPARTYLPEALASETLDTPEHRWLYARLDAARTSLATIQREENRLARSARRHRTLEDLADAQRRMGRLLQRSPLAACTPGRSPAPTQRLLTAPGYADAYRACNTLSLGLSLAKGPVLLATRDLHLLYEMWCYLTVVRTIAEHVGQAIPARAFFRAKHHGVRLLLEHGRAHGVAFEHEGRQIEVAYNPHFAARPGLLAQRPDIVLSVVNAEQTKHFVLDAKYRREDASGYVRRYGAAGPPEDVLGDLHRYRDAILQVADGQVQRPVLEAAALFPGRAQKTFLGSQLWKSIETVGVGAIPLLPSNREWLRAWLARIA